MNNPSKLTAITDYSEAGVYTDVAGIKKLKTGAKNKDPAAIHQAALQFEAVFAQMMLKSMRAANESFDSGLFKSDSMNFYKDLQDNQMAQSLTKGRGLGLTAIIEKQLTPSHAKNEVGSQVELVNTEGGIPLTKKINNSINTKNAWLGAAAPQTWYSEIAPIHTRVVDSSLIQTGSAIEPINAPINTKAIAELPGVPGAKKSKRFASKEDFVQALMPQAQKVAEAFGIDPRVLIAQAALETNWGKSIIQAPDGANSHNLFGIKANRAWEGDSVTVATHEYRGGRKVREQGAFRSYGSYANSFADYVNFLQGNPRYENVFQQVKDPTAYAHALQDAGYATDPLYAKKIMSVYNSAPMQSVFQ